MSDQWLSAHIYYSGPFDVILSEGVTPYITDLKQKHKIKRYFYIRYWEGGPHIRIRIKADSNRLRESIVPEFVNYFSSYMKKYSADRKELEQVKNSDKQLYPNYSIKFDNYIPEIKRYGGEHTIELAEEHFQHSSDTILSLISSTNNWDYNRALGVALQLHLSFAYAIGLNLTLSKLFFNQIFTAWLPWASPYFSMGPNSHRNEWYNELILSFQETLNKQKDYIIPHMKTFWQLLDNNYHFDEVWLNNWIDKVRIMDRNFLLKQQSGKLISPYSGQNIITESTNKSLIERWYIYYSFIHMTNNRLGILNRDESYLSYLLMKGLEYV